MKEPKGVWYYERSSGYDGFRCSCCGVWIYASKQLKCNCDRKNVCNEPKYNMCMLTIDDRDYVEYQLEDLYRELHKEIPLLRMRDALVYLSKLVAEDIDKNKALAS